MNGANNNEIVIVGGGPVGLAFALAAARLRDIKITLVERQTLALARLSSHFDHRVYALSPGSKILLEALGVWQRIPRERIEPVRVMQVFGDTAATGAIPAARPEIDFAEGTPLAFIVEYSSLMQALLGQVREHPETICVLDDTPVKHVEFAGLGDKTLTHKVVLDDGSIQHATLLIAADGAASPLRKEAGIAAEAKDYESDGVVANFKIQQPHGGIARQWFSPDGVLAYLPLPDRQISIVWSVSCARADELVALDDAAFAVAVAAAGEHALGELNLCSVRARFPLRRMMAKNYVQPGFALMGDAAHTVHPLAGQGANLGFADVRTMWQVLQNRSALSGIGDLALLRQYERARREDALVMGGVTDSLRSLFLSESPLAIRIRRDGLNMANRLRIAKSMMMSHAMK